jgi:hypothetical protein
MSKNKPFWTDSSFEPKQSFKFKLILSFGNEQNQVLEIPYYYVVSVDKPSFTVGQRTGKLLNEERKFPTNVTWSPVRIVLYRYSRQFAFVLFKHVFKQRKRSKLF